MKNKKVIVFDLDDTLLSELDFLKSAFYEIATFLNGDKELYEKMLNLHRENRNVFEYLTKHYPSYSLKFFLEKYRNHYPNNLSSLKKTKELLEDFKKSQFILGLITDGRSVTQRNKLKASGLGAYFDTIVISEEIGTEKPHPNNYEIYSKYAAEQYFYIGDNTSKDFVTPNKLGWTTIGLQDAGFNIHKQNLLVATEFLPKYWIKDLPELKDLIG